LQSSKFSEKLDRVRGMCYDYDMIEITKCQIVEALETEGESGRLLRDVILQRCKMALKDGEVRITGCGCEIPCMVDLRKFKTFMQVPEFRAVMELPAF
jgi:hypothetical protein